MRERYRLKLPTNVQNEQMAIITLYIYIEMHDILYYP